ncbi:CUB and zona pellucida-like domain-containing protein 1 [Leucoraja erinacea]|uniref:CUB and zona pellucida-like domain-containing protein 1 n=1 Tax=Leucoraja erinaceus TaxID=7782 RepID=UPI0024543416|nr:CUB and zona pellucida-like domain-containing protein 1 [Leucoraja erinacea]
MVLGFVSLSEMRRSASFVCMTQAAEYTFPSSVLSSAGVSVADVHLVDPTCKAHQQDENWVVITAPFDSCGTTISNDTGKIVYINTIFGSIPRTPIHRLEIELKCEMSMNESVRMGFMLQTNHLVRFGHYNVSFKLFRSANYDDPVLQFPYQIELNGTLYVQMEAETTDNGVQVFTDTCVSVPSLNTNKAPYTIIQNGCVNDMTFKTHETSDSRKQRFSFHVFKFEDFPQVYIFCDLVLCHSGSSPNRCERGCVPSRKKRDLRTRWQNDKAAHLSQGPVVFPTSALGVVRLCVGAVGRGPCLGEGVPAGPGDGELGPATSQAAPGTQREPGAGSAHVVLGE